MSYASVRIMQLEDLGVIGNCQFSALIHNSGEIVWCCLPRFDSEPVFSTLLDDQDGGRFRIGPASGEIGAQRYLANTNILETTFRTSTGSFRVIDFAPRFLQFGRAFRPTQLMRIVEPIEGTPRIAVVCEPRLGWSKERPAAVQGSTPRALRGIRQPAAAHHRHSALLPGGPALHADRAAPPGAQLGRAGRRAARAAVRALLERDRAATGSAG